MHTCMLQYEMNRIQKSFVHMSYDDILNLARKRTLNNLLMFPGFPQINLIVSLSGHAYEKKECYSNLVFYSEYNQNKNMSFEIKYSDPILFSSDNLRYIRKLLESVDTDHSLVFFETNGMYYAIGTVSNYYLKDTLAVRIKVEGHMRWKAYINILPLFEYKNGNYYPFLDEFNKNEVSTELVKVFRERISINQIKVFCKIIEVIYKLHHGTSIVIYGDNDYYESEAARLARVTAGHGIKLFPPLKFSEMSDAKIATCLNQITKIDGGLLFNLDAVCGVMGCILDGEVSPEYDKGSQSRGSRYNSVKLYIETRKEQCFGIIVSDDGSIEYVSNRSQP